MKTVYFTHPLPVSEKTRIHPVFMPFSGCSADGRCVFCAQNIQTGTVTKSLDAILAKTEEDLQIALDSSAAPREIAFYGGTFTALPASFIEKYLALAAKFRKAGLVSRIRCSTRPDKVDGNMLGFLSALGVDLIELGVQSFDDAALMASRRGYEAAQAINACMRIKEYNIGLGIQLMPGLPGSSHSTFRRDVDMVCKIVPECVRLYPCLVFRNTPLAEMWKSGSFRPWPLKRAVYEVGAAIPPLSARKIRIIRMGLAPQPGLEENILAGPHHPSFGYLCTSQALYFRIRTLAALVRHPVELSVPKRRISEFLGFRRGFVGRWSALGLTPDRIKTVPGEIFRLVYRD